MLIGCSTSTTERDTLIGELSIPLADLDGDGDVDVENILTLASNFGVDYVDGNVDLVGNVMFPDFLILAENYIGEVGPNAATSVPEPGGGALLLTSIVSMLLWRRNATDR